MAGLIDINCLNKGSAPKDYNEPLCCIIKIVENLLNNYVWYVILLLLLGMVIYGGVMYSLSGGNAQNKEKAKNILMWAIIGASVSFLVGVVLNIFFGVVNGTIAGFKSSIPIINTNCP